MPPRKKAAPKTNDAPVALDIVKPPLPEHEANLELLLKNFDNQVKMRIQNMQMEATFQEQMLSATKSSILASVPLELRNITLREFVEVYNGNISDVLRLESFERQFALDDFVLQNATKNNTIKPTNISSMSVSTRSNLKRSLIGVSSSHADKENAAADTHTRNTKTAKQLKAEVDKKLAGKRDNFTNKLLAAIG